MALLGVFGVELATGLCSLGVSPAYGWPVALEVVDDGDVGPVALVDVEDFLYWELYAVVLPLVRDDAVDSLGVVLGVWPQSGVDDLSIDC